MAAAKCEAVCANRACAEIAESPSTRELCSTTSRSTGTGAPSAGPVRSYANVPGDHDPAQDLAWGTLEGPNATTVAGGGLASDPSGSEVVLFGGENGTTLSDGTNVYNESTNSWTSLSPTTAPSPRADFAIASNDEGRYAVLFGGIVNATSRRPDNSTWIYSFPQQSWTNVTSSVAPPAREDAAFAIDPALGVGLLFGGWNPDFGPTSTVTYDDLWQFDLTTHAWVELDSQGDVPPPLEGASLAWDPLDGTFLLYGGCYPCSSTVWSLNPSTGTWTELPSASGTVPSARASGVWSWDPSDQSVVLFGGTNGVSTFNDTYEYLPASNRWIEESTPIAPSARSVPASTWLNVTGNETLLLAGGLGPPTVTAGLWRLAPTANLSVEVENASSGASIVGARVSISGSFDGTTDAVGYLNLTELDPVEISLEVARLGYAVAESTFWLAPASSAAVHFDLTPVAPAWVGIQLEENGTSTGLGGVLVNLTVDHQNISSSPQYSGPSGWAIFTQVPTESPAPVAVAIASAYENYTAVANFTLPPGSDVMLPLFLTPYPRLEIEVTGTLANASRVPVQNAEVTANGTPIGLTQPNGWLNRTSPLPGGPVALSVSAYGFSTNSSNVTLPERGTFLDRFALVGLPFGNISVSVLDKLTHQPIVGASAEAISEDNRTTVKTHVIKGTSLKLPAPLSVPPGYYYISVSAYGYYPYNSTSPILVAPHAIISLTVNLTLLPGANVSVLVHDRANDAPISDALVAMGDQGPNQTNGRGWINFTNVHFGIANVSASAPGFQNNTTTVALAPYENITEFLVNLTPLAPGTGSGPYGGELLGAFSLAPYLVVLILAIVGVAAFLLVLRVEKRRTPEGGEGSRGGPPLSPP